MVLIRVEEQAALKLEGLQFARHLLLPNLILSYGYGRGKPYA